MADFLGSNLFSPSAPSENFLKTPKTRIKVDESCHLKRHMKAPQSASHGCADKSPQHSSRNGSITGNQLKSYSRGSSDIILEGSQGCDPKKRIQLTSPVSASKSLTPAYENMNFGVKRLENIPEEMSHEIQEQRTFELESQMQPVYQNLNFRKADPEANHKNAISFNLSKDEKFTSSDNDEIDSHQISSEINDSMVTGLTASELKAKYPKSEDTSVSSSTNETDHLAEVQKQMTRMNIRHLANNLAISNNSSSREMLERNAKNEKKTSTEDTAVTLSPGIGLSPQNSTNTSHLGRAAISSPDDSTFIVNNQIHVNQHRKIIRLLHLLLGIQWRRKAKKEDKKSLVEEEETQEPYQEWGKRRRNSKRSQQDRQKAASGNGSVSTKKRRRPRKKNVYRAGRRVRRSLGRGCRYIGHGLANMTNIIPEMSYVGPATRRDYRSDYITPYD